MLFIRSRNPGPFLQLLGAGGLLVVVLAHICEALQLFPGMHWGLEHSAGHYLDIVSAIVGISLFPLRYFWMSLRTPNGSR